MTGKNHFHVIPCFLSLSSEILQSCAKGTVKLELLKKRESFARASFHEQRFYNGTIATSVHTIRRIDSTYQRRDKCIYACAFVQKGQEFDAGASSMGSRRTFASDVHISQYVGYIPNICDKGIKLWEPKSEVDEIGEISRKKKTREIRASDKIHDEHHWN